MIENTNQKSKIWNNIPATPRPTTSEKNNLPIEVRQKYCYIIEKYQLITHYENGIITKEELIEKL